MAGYRSIRFERERGVALITLNNPERRNALTEEMKEEILSALQGVEGEAELRALVLTGAGTAFCAGGDIRRIGQRLTPEEIRETMQRSQRLLRKLFYLEKPVVAAVNGDAVGIGCNLALAADFVLASEKVRFAEIFVKIGLVPDFGGLYLLPRLVGLAKSKELTYLGEMLSAQEAKEMGLIYKVVPHEELRSEALEFAQRLAAMPTLAIGRAKRVLNRAFNLTLEEVLEREIELQTFLHQTEDHREGIQAFLEKRKPRFQGR